MRRIKRSIFAVVFLVTMIMGTSVSAQTARKTGKVENVASCVIAQWGGSYATLTARVSDATQDVLLAENELYGKLVYPGGGYVQKRFSPSCTYVSKNRYISSKYYSYDATSMITKSTAVKLSVRVKHN